MSEQRASGVFTARPGQELHAAMVEAARRDGVSLASWTNDLFARAVGRPAMVPRTLDDLQKAEVLDAGDVAVLQRPDGIVVVAGSIASGKTTLLKAMMRDRFGSGVSIAVVANSTSEYRVPEVNALYFSVAPMMERARQEHPGDTDDTLAANLADSIIRTVVMMDVGFVVVEAMESRVFGELGSALAVVGTGLAFETHGATSDAALERLRHLGVDLSSQRMVVAIAERDSSTGCHSYRTETMQD